MKLAGAHVLVSGASQGVGAALTRELCRRGSMVSMVARNKEKLEALAEQTGASAHPADLSDPDRVSGLIVRVEEHGGPVDVLINNAALGGVGEFVKMPHASLAAHVNTNLLAPMSLCHQVLPGMLARGHGTVVVVSSVAGEFATRNAAPYCASKAGLSLFANDLRRELKRTPVNTLLVVLGEVDTDMLIDVRADPVMAQVAKRVGKLRALSAEQVATGLADALESDRKIAVMPKAAAPIVGLRNLPSRLMDLAMLGVR